MSEATQEQAAETIEAPPQPVSGPNSNGAPTLAVPPPTHRDVQRAALRDLVALSTECATTETEIELKYQAAVEAADKEVDTGVWSAEQRSKGAEEQVRQKAKDRQAAIEAKYAAEASVLKKQDASIREKIIRDSDPPQREIRQKFDQAVWLADSVLDTTQGQIHEDLKKRRGELNGEQADLSEMEKRAAALLFLYGVPAPAIEGDSAEITDPDTEFPTQREIARKALIRLNSLLTARLFVGAKPYVIAFMACALAALGMQLYTGKTEPQWKQAGIAAGAVLGVCLVAGIFLRILAKSKARELYTRLGHAIIGARRASDLLVKRAIKEHDDKIAAAQATRDGEVKSAKDKVTPILARIKAQRDAAIQAATDGLQKQLAALDAQRIAGKAEVEDRKVAALAETQQKKEREQQRARQKHEQISTQSRQQYDSSRAALEDRLRDGLAHTQAPIEEREGAADPVPLDWSAVDWPRWKPPKRFAEVVRFGEIEIDLRKFADSVPRQGELKLQLPPKYSVPAFVGFPRQASMLVEADRVGREIALRAVQMIMVRLLTSLPPGRVRFTLIDPVGLGQNFAGFMHLADFDEALVGGRIWTDAEQINQRLADLTDHMETVIQKYLRNEYETIDEYNAQAGELAEPYRFLVIADFPVGFEGDAFRRLSSIATSGARCGVYILVARDRRHDLPNGTHLDDLEAHCVTLVQEGEKFVWKDDVFKQFPLAMDLPPTEETLTKILQVVGKYAKEARRVEVPFDSIAPKVADFWTLHSNEELRVPVGRMGATRLQMMRLGKGVAQHVIIAGKTGSGKSTLLHALVTNLAMWYSPDEVELYLIDFKKGVEFKTYATHALPHARAIAVESDREFGLSVLQRLDGELSRRGDLFRKIGVQDINSYRGAVPDAIMPRTLLIIDEFQEFFTEDDKLAQDAALLLDRLVRQGRAFGVHVLLGSQTIGGSSGLGRATIGQMAVRVALMTSESDSQLILGDGNSAARLLSRPGEAIYNDQGGLVEGNSPFQVAWLPDEGRDIYLERVNKRLEQYVAQYNRRPELPIVFEGNAPADVRTNGKLADLIALEKWPAPTTAPMAWLGDPVAIREACGVSFRRQSGSNLMIIGQQEESAIAMFVTALISIATQQKPGTAIFHVMDGVAADSPFAGILPRVTALLPHEVKMVEWRAVEETINGLSQELKCRQADEDPAAPSIYIVIYGLQRYRMFRKSEDNFSFSASDEEKKPQADKQFTELIREGPALGIHTITWVDTPAAIDRTLDRGMMREFDNRILFQMSAADSSNLIDSPLANKLGFYRALSYSEEQGFMEKFRPYALPVTEWLENVKTRLAARK